MEVLYIGALFFASLVCADHAVLSNYTADSCLQCLSESPDSSNRHYYCAFDTLCYYNEKRFNLSIIAGEEEAKFASIVAANNLTVNSSDA